jgi:hypothetical protein
MQPPPLAAQFEDCRMKGKPPKVRQEATSRKGGIEFTNGDEPGVKLRKANGKGSVLKVQQNLEPGF